MHDVVQQVLEAEQRSKGILAKVEAEAEQITTEARRKAQELIQTARRETAEQTQAMVTRAEEQAEREKHERLAQAADDIETAIQLNEQTVRGAAEEILRCVCERHETPSGQSLS
jgi:vacuolar-type H+-ATPase subunit H